MWFQPLVGKVLLLPFFIKFLSEIVVKCISADIKKISTGENVLATAVHRIEWLSETFSSVCLSFSGGKDSTVLLHLTADVARSGFAPIFPDTCYHLTHY